MNVQYTVSVDLGSLESQSFESLEKKIRDGIFQAGRELMTQVWTLWEELFRRSHAGAENLGRREANFKTSVGEIRFARLRLRHRGRFRVPLDEWTQVTSRERATPGFLSRLESAVVQSPFRQATAQLARETGVTQTPMSSWRQTQRLAEKSLQSQLRSQAKVIPLQDSPQLLSYAVKTWRDDPEALDPRCPLLCIEADGTYCKNQDPLGLRHEVKIAILYTQKKNISRGKKPRFEIEDKLSLIQFPGESLSQFQSRIARTARLYFGATPRTLVIVRGDGDPWIQDIARDHFFGSVYWLDPWHVNKKLRESVGPQEFEKFRHFVHEWNPDGLVAALREAYLEPDLEKLGPRGALVLHPKKLEQIEQFIQYIQNNRDGLLPRPELKAIRPRFPGLLCRGSGAIERSVDQLVGERCKRKRMAWSRAGLDNLLLLRKNQINRQYGPTLRTQPAQVSISPLGAPT